MATYKKRTTSTGELSWSASIRKKSHPHIQKSFKTREEAEKWAEITEKSMNSADPIVNKTINNMIDRYYLEVHPTKSAGQQSDEKAHIAYWKEHLGSRFIKDVTSLDIEPIADMVYERTSKFTGRPLTAESRRKYLMTLSYIFNIACTRWKWAHSNPVLFVDKHACKIKKLKEKSPVALDLLAQRKASYIEGIKKEMDRRGIDSLKDLAKYINIPRETIRLLMKPDGNSTLLMMVTVAAKLEIDFKFIWEKNHEKT